MANAESATWLASQTPHTVKTRCVRAFCLHLCALLCATLCAGVLTPAHASTPLERNIRDALSQNFVTANLLTSGDAVRFGFWNFDPNTYLDLDDGNLGSLEAQELRQHISTFSLPYHWNLALERDGKPTNDTLQLGVKAAYFATDRDTQLISSNSNETDNIKSQVTSVSFHSALIRRFTPHWQLTGGLNLHASRYKNKTRFSTRSRQIADATDGLLTNYSADAWLAEPHLKATYFVGGENAEVRIFSSFHYLAGQTFHTHRRAHEAKPEAWYWTNGVRWRHPYVTRVLPGQNVWMQAARYDLGGDLSEPLGNHYYYEAGVGWLLDIKRRIPFIDNIGIGINVNYGSVLRGGTLILLLNEN